MVPLKREAYWLKMTGMSSADAARGTGKLDGKLNRCQVQRLYRSRQVEFRKRGLREAGSQTVTASHVCHLRKVASSWSMRIPSSMQ